MTEINIVKGFRDFSGSDGEKRDEIKKILVETFGAYGFEPAETPIIEYEEFVKDEGASAGRTQDEVISDIFKLKDKGGRKLALRYEFTFQLKRLARGKKLPYKRYQIGEVFRDEPVGSNRVRQITQADADIIGSTIRDEAEILSLTAKILEKLGVKFVIYINNRKLLNYIISQYGVKEKDRADVIREIDKLDKFSEREVKVNLKKYGAEKLINVLKQPESCFKKYKSYAEIEELKKYCKLYDIDKKIKFSASLARGLSYYNSTVFEVKTAGMKETICAGGSYLVNDKQSTGISFGLERLSQLVNLKSLKSTRDKQKILIISIGQDNKAIKLAENLRKKGKQVILMYNKISRALEYANSVGIKYVLFVGEKEVKAKKFKLRDMENGRENMLNEKEIIKKIS